jgi:hypothetical protein
VTEARGIAQFADGLGQVYTVMGRALKPGAPLAFTFHHNRLEAYHAIGVAILDAGLNCSTALPCPGEMSGSIHIHGTESSILDTVFVCRKDFPTRTVEPDIIDIVCGELAQLKAAGVKPTAGDIRCIVYGRMTRLAINNLLPRWDRTRPTAERLAKVSRAIADIGEPQVIINALSQSPKTLPKTLFDDLEAPIAVALPG